MPIRDPDLMKIRAEKIIAMKVDQNMTTKAIAEQMNLSHDTVERTMSWAKKAGLLVKYEDRILAEIVPKAIEALKTALDDGDGELAMKVLQNTLWLSQQGSKKTTGASAPAGDHEDDLSAYIARIRQKASEEEEVADGVIIGPSEGRIEGSTSPTAIAAAEENAGESYPRLLRGLPGVDEESGSPDVHPGSEKDDVE